jgi:Domain of unknown function (DUF4912)
MTISSPEISNSKLLSATELFVISQEISRNFSPVVSVKSLDLARRIALTPKELREISEDISRKYVPTLKSKTSNVVVLPIDPENFYVAWSLGQTETSTTVTDQPKDLVLRIYPKQETFPGTSTADTWFDVDLDQSKTRQKIPYPNGQQAYAYTVAISLRDENKQITTLATSNAIHTPRGNSTLHTACENKALSPHLSQAFSYGQERLQNITKNASGQGVT